VVCVEQQYQNCIEMKIWNTSDSIVQNSHDAAVAAAVLELFHKQFQRLPDENTKLTEMFGINCSRNDRIDSFIDDRIDHLVESAKRVPSSIDGGIT